MAWGLWPAGFPSHRALLGYVVIVGSEELFSVLGLSLLGLDGSFEAASVLR